MDWYRREYPDDLERALEAAFDLAIDIYNFADVCRHCHDHGAHEVDLGQINHYLSSIPLALDRHETSISDACTSVTAEASRVQSAPVSLGNVRARTFCRCLSVLGGKLFKCFASGLQGDTHVTADNVSCFCAEIHNWEQHSNLEELDTVLDLLQSEIDAVFQARENPAGGSVCESEDAGWLDWKDEETGDADDELRSRIRATRELAFVLDKFGFSYDNAKPMAARIAADGGEHPIQEAYAEALRSDPKALRTIAIGDGLKAIGRIASRRILYSPDAEAKRLRMMADALERSAARSVKLPKVDTAKQFQIIESAARTVVVIGKDVESIENQDQRSLIKAIIESKGEWIVGSNVLDVEGMALGERAATAKGGLPPSLLTYIDSLGGRGGGYRWTWPEPAPKRTRKKKPSKSARE